MATRIKQLEKKYLEFAERDRVDPEALDMALEYAWEMALQHPAKSRQISREALKYARKCKHEPGIAHGYRNLAYLDLLAGRMESAFKSAIKAIELFRNYGNLLGEATAVDILNHIYTQLGDYDNALETGLKNLALNQKAGYRRGVAWAYHNIGIIYSELRDYPVALEYYQWALKEFETIKYRPGVNNLLFRIGEAYRRQKLSKKALETFEKCIRTGKGIETAYVIGGAYSEMGSAYFDLGEHKKAIKFMLKGLKAYDDLGTHGNSGFTGQMLNRIAEFYLATKDLDKAEDYFNQTLSLKGMKKFKPMVMQTHEGLSQVYEARGDFKQALHHVRKSAEFREKIFGEENTLISKNMETRLKVESAEKEAEIHRLKYVELNKEREKSEKLLLNILPAKVAEELKHNGKSEPVQVKSSTVLFTDFVGFTQIAEKLKPVQLIGELDDCFRYFDSVIEKYKLEKLKTIGDAYMCAGGIPINNRTHALDCVLAALEISEFIAKRNRSHKRKKEPYWDVRIGINTGALIAGVIGEKKFSYDIWGDTVNTASRMESSGAPGKINISNSTYRSVQNYFDCEHRGKLEVKSKGRVDMYFVNGLKKEFRANGKSYVPNEKFIKQVRN